MTLKARGGIRILAPIPGKAAIGIEVPNTTRSVVYFREIAESESFAEADRPLTFAIGKTTSGDPVVASLMASVVFFAGVGIVLQVIGSSNLPDLKIGRR